MSLYICFHELLDEGLQLNLGEAPILHRWHYQGELAPPPSNIDQENVNSKEYWAGEASGLYSQPRKGLNCPEKPRDREEGCVLTSEEQTFTLKGKSQSECNFLIKQMPANLLLF